MIGSWFDGVNCTLFAYGMSASGKTHTMVGSDAHPGIFPRLAEYLFQHIGEIAAESEYIVNVGAI